MKTSYPYTFILRFFLAAILSAFTLEVIPQETSTCAENLKSAQSLFNKGQVSQVPAMLRECMKSGFKREEQLAAYKLLIQSYLFEDKLEQADSTMLAFLKRNPEYQLSPTDHSSFVFLFNTFTVKPVVQIALHIGTNMPFMTFVYPVTLSSEPGKVTYSHNALNLFTSLELKFALSRKLELNIEGGFSQFSFSKVEEMLGFGKTNYSENLSRIEIPVSATYNFLNFGKFTVYGRAGFGASFNLKSTAKTSFNPTDLNNFEVITGADVNRKDSRILMDLFGQAGAGIKFKTPGGFINLEIRSNLGILNQVVRGGASAQELKWAYKYVDDDFNMNNLNFNIGYTQIFYKPSKRK